ncbi:predicted protein [Histoplasma capsulatum G186AR]|uniref:Uncharacterized protein n=1 Tax=Ajellomyces capsulatus (strain G186AR / H82 / ATCC MYA-2454 / RMSCC 2432) TaxID=447093 RepID=C0NJJ4_AJECG|nr:uncharacterized protein HCBG_03324 [Histoplasma capsulatum G186AR]EEH08035.1 predicted protein [Histoplasma capsulatum G186AR]
MISTSFKVAGREPRMPPANVQACRPTKASSGNIPGNGGLVNNVNSWSPSKVPTRYPDTSRLHTSFRRYRFWEKLFFVAGPADKMPFPQDANVNAQETLGVEGALYALDP